MKLLVTGCRGFLGNSIGQLVLRRGYDVLGIDRFPVPRSGWTGKYIQKDVARSDLSSIIRDFRPDFFFHAAGSASVDFSFVSPYADLEAGLATWARTLESIRDSKVRPVIIFPSSAAIYGNPITLPVREDAPVVPISPYGFHKAACELLAREYVSLFDQQIIVGRFFSIFGAAQRRLLMWDLYQQLAGPEQTVWLHGGTESRDYLDIDDAGAVLFSLIDQCVNLGKNTCQQASYRVVNIASGEQIKVIDVARQLRDFVAPDKDIRCRAQKMAGHPEHWCADISLLRSLIPDWCPKPFSLALSRCVASWQKKQSFLWK